MKIGINITEKHPRLGARCLRGWSAARRETRLRTDGWRAYGILELDHGLNVESRPTPPEKVEQWLPIVHTAIANLKRFLLERFMEFLPGSCRNILMNSFIDITVDIGSHDFQTGFSKSVPIVHQHHSVSYIMKKNCYMFIGKLFYLAQFNW